MDKKPILWAVLLCLGSALAAQAPFVFALGGSGEEEARRAISTPNGDYIVVGYIAGDGGIVHGAGGARDGLVFRMAPNGNVLWAWAIGGNAADEFVDIAHYKGYYYCVGNTKSWVKKGSSNDIFLVKIAENGTVVWAKNFGHPSGTGTQLSDDGFGITATAMSGVILVGVNGSTSPTESDIVAIRVLEDGKIGFGKSYNTQLGADLARDILRDATGFVITAGMPASGGSGRDGLMYKIDNAGGVVWSKRIDASLGNIDGPETAVFNPANQKIVAGGLKEALPETDPIIYQLNADGTQGGAGKIFSKTTNDRRRGRLFARGDGGSGYLFPLYAANNGTSLRSTMDAVVFSIDNSLNFNGQIEIGWPNSYDYFNHVVSCENNSQILGFGATWYPPPPDSTVQTNILISRFTMPVDQAGFCGVNTTWSSTSSMDNNSNQTLQVADLIAGYATDALIASFPSSIDVKNYLVKFPCPVASPLPPGYAMAFSGVENFKTAVEPIECPTPDCPKNLSFKIAEKLVSAEFKILDSGEFVRFETTEQDVLDAGIKYDELKLESGEYFWELRSVYQSGAIEYKNGEITIK